MRVCVRTLVPTWKGEWVDGIRRKYPEGTRVRVKFGEYYQGRVQGHRTTSRGTLNWVVYQDGDCEEMEDKEIAAWLKDEAATRGKQSNNNSSSNNNKNRAASCSGTAQTRTTQTRTARHNHRLGRAGNRSSSTNPKPIKMEDAVESNDCIIAEARAKPKKNQSADNVQSYSQTTPGDKKRTAVTTETTRPIKKQSQGPSEASASTVSFPDQAHSSSSVRQILKEFDVDSKVKIEGEKVQLSKAIKDNIKEVTTKWIAANTDPNTGMGRYVFRKGCHKHCITKLLGGVGTDQNPVSSSDRQFIKKGDFYVAGNEAFNPYGPRFPGDPGLADMEGLAANPNQKEFHVFVQCGSRPLSRLWQGNLAKGGRMVRISRQPAKRHVRFNCLLIS